MSGPEVTYGPPRGGEDPLRMEFRSTPRDASGMKMAVDFPGHVQGVNVTVWVLNDVGVWVVLWHAGFGQMTMSNDADELIERIEALAVFLQ